MYYCFYTSDASDGGRVIKKNLSAHYPQKRNKYGNFLFFRPFTPPPYAVYFFPLRPEKCRAVRIRTYLSSTVPPESYVLYADKNTRRGAHI